MNSGIFLIFPLLSEKGPNSVFQSPPEIIQWKIFLCSNWTWWLPLWFTFTWSTGKVILFRLLLNYGWKGENSKVLQYLLEEEEQKIFRTINQQDLIYTVGYSHSVSERVSKYQLRCNVYSVLVCQLLLKYKTSYWRCENEKMRLNFTLFCPSVFFMEIISYSLLVDCFCKVHSPLGKFISYVLYSTLYNSLKKPALH